MLLLQLLVLIAFTWYIVSFLKFRREAMTWPYWKIVPYRVVLLTSRLFETDCYCITNGNKYLALDRRYLALKGIPQTAIRINWVKWVYGGSAFVTVFEDKETAEKVLVALHKHYGTGGGKPKQFRCNACREVGMTHCSDPANCGGMKEVVPD